MIKGVIRTPLKTISVDEGNVMHGMRNDDAGFSGFGEAYFSMVNLGAIKGWKRHRSMVCNFVVPIGEVKVVIYDDRVNSFEEIVLSPYNYFRLTIPPMVWVGFQGLHEHPSLLLNIASIIHDPAEADNKDINTIAYTWSVKK